MSTHNILWRNKKKLNVDYHQICFSFCLLVKSLNNQSLPICLFLSLEVAPSKNSVIRASRACRDVSSDAYKYTYYMSQVMRKPALCICENKDTGQLHGDHAADQHLWFWLIIVQSLYIRNFKATALEQTDFWMFLHRK